MADTIKDILEIYRPKALDVISPINGTITQDQALAEIKRIVENAKPELYRPELTHKAYQQGYRDAKRHYHTNLMKALGEE